MQELLHHEKGFGETEAESKWELQWWLGAVAVQKKKRKKKPSVSSSGSRKFSPNCSFCGEAKYLRQTKLEKLIKATHLKVDQRLRECAVGKGDEKISAFTIWDIAAAEVRYHPSSYKNYTRVKTKEPIRQTRTGLRKLLLVHCTKGMKQKLVQTFFSTS